MDFLWIVLGGLFAVVGCLGAVLPVLPGPPLAYAALWMIWLADRSEVSVATLIVMGVMMVLITVLDYIAPVWLTRKGGGTKMGERGATVGLIVGFFIGPLGMIFGPLVGALIGELVAGTPREQAVKVSLMSFVGFLLTSGLKLFYGCIILWMYIVFLWP